MDKEFVVYYNSDIKKVIRTDPPELKKLIVSVGRFTGVVLIPGDLYDTDDNFRKVSIRMEITSDE